MHHKIPRTLGEFLRKNRQYEDEEKFQISQKEVAEGVGITELQLKQYEANRVNPSISTVLKLCDFLDASWSELEDTMFYHVFEFEDFRYPGTKEPALTQKARVTDATPRKSGRPSKTARHKIGKRGIEIAAERLEDRGYVVEIATDEAANLRNFDLIATKGDQARRIKVKAKRHDTKASLSVSWKQDEPTFNRVETAPSADAVVLVRFTDDDNECFVMTAAQANDEADWFAHKMIELGNVPKFLQPYVGKKERQSRFTFNERAHWEPFAENWDVLDTGE